VLATVLWLAVSVVGQREATRVGDLLLVLPMLIACPFKSLRARQTARLGQSEDKDDGSDGKEGK
jgi:hypothetical protein